MTQLAIKGNNILVTDSIKMHANKTISKINERYDATLLILSLKKDKSNLYVAILLFKNQVTEKTITQTGRDLYQVIRTLGSRGINTISRAHKQKQSEMQRKHKPLMLDRDE
jgi:ribosome-associated translation inhibitor RaiA